MNKLIPKLQKLTQNLWWTWKPEVRTIFRDLDLELYHKAHQNPMSVLKLIQPDQLEQRAADVDIPARVDRALRQLNEYLTPVTTWGLTHAGALGSRPIAYFCMEFGIHESLPIYSGGLGILAGDHLKAASDLGVPLVGVGLLYHEGYTSQVLNADLWQQDVVEPFDIADLPMVHAVDRFGAPVQVSVELPGRLVHAAVLEVQVGRIRLILLDTRVKQNDPKDVSLTARLYGGDQRMRIEQELLLGVGGARALRALGINASVFHLNEGHSAFALLERARHRIQADGMEPRLALQEVAAAAVFTTHTPVEAGHDRFPADLAAEHLGPLAEGLKARTIRFIRERQAQTRARLGLPEIDPAPLDPDALTIGFARRFVPYKRPDLLFTDLDRLDRLVNHPDRPVNLVFSGRAHPADNTGKALIQKVARLLEDPRFRHRIVFLENYNIRVGRLLYQGIDAWLNNPQRPLEACGTSGMKVVLNGGLHISIRDGWWAEAYNGHNGFAIGTGETHANQAIQDQRDAEDLFRLLEEEVVPMYYENRNSVGIPRCWVDRMKQSIRTLAWRFNADRMVQNYVDQLYLPAAVGSSCQMPPP